jgi:tetratricopeptide (TPR) repeat protein
MKTNRPAGIFLVAVLAVALSMPAGAQQSVFVQALSELTAAIEGTYGDEGAQVGPAIDRLSGALAEWDREIEAAETGLRTALREAPSSKPEPGVFERRMSLGRMYTARGRLADALSQLDAASRLEPQRADVHVLRGLVLSADGKPREALEAFRTARAMDSGNPVTAYYLFREATTSGQAKDAREAADALAAFYPEILKRDPQQKATAFIRFKLLQTASGPPVLPLAAYRQAYQDLAHSEYQRAIADFRNAAASDPLVIDAAGTTSTIRAVDALKHGRMAEARSLLQQSSTLETSSEARRVLGLVYWAESDYDKSVESLTAAIRRSPRDERARLALARVLSSAGRDADAERALQETLRVLPDSALAHWWLASTVEHANRFAEAREEFQRAAAGAVSGASQIHAAVGRFASGAADFPGAIDAFTRAVSADPNDPAMHRFLAIALVQLDRTGEALAEFVAALLIDPRDAEAHAGIGLIHLNAGRPADAVDVLRRATDLSPTNTETRYAFATALERVGRTQEAAQHFAVVEQAQRQMFAERRRTLSSDVLKEEAALRATEGRFEAAIGLYEKALALAADPAVYAKLADLYAQVGRTQDAARARAIYEKARQGDGAGGNTKP